MDQLNDNFYVDFVRALGLASELFRNVRKRLDVVKLKLSMVVGVALVLHFVLLVGPVLFEGQERVSLQ